MITSLDLLHATNLWGKLDAELRARVERVITDPTDATWDDAYSIILDSTTWITLWQAVTNVDPTFPRTGPRSTIGGNRERWAKVPTRETLLEAIRYAVNRGAADAARDESLSRVEDHADPTWLDRATEIVTNLPEGAEFTTDFVWDHLGDLEAETHEPRALGAVMRRLAGLGIIHKTGSYRPSARRECHARPIPVWRRSNGG